MKPDRFNRDSRLKGGIGLKLSTRGQYALHAMIFLAKKADEGPQSLRTIAEDGLPEQYLEQLLGTLRRSGLVRTVRGATGGYSIARKPADITVADIIQSTEGPVNLSSCASEDSDCPHSNACATRDVWMYLTDNINDLLRGITLQDVLQKRPYGLEEKQPT